MTNASAGRPGASVRLSSSAGEPVGAYVVDVADDLAVGRAEFTDVDAGAPERIFFHTEVDKEFGGRGLAGLLIAQALEDSIRQGITVVPVCPLFARHLREHGTEFAAAGGRFRPPTADDIALISRTVRGRK